jgi:hypothetical protein
MKDALHRLAGDHRCGAARQLTTCLQQTMIAMTFIFGCGYGFCIMHIIFFKAWSPAAHVSNTWLCSAAVAGRLYNTMTGSCLATLTGHTGEISKVAFNPQVRVLDWDCLGTRLSRGL